MYYNKIYLSHASAQVSLEIVTVGNWHYGNAATHRCAESNRRSGVHQAYTWLRASVADLRPIKLCNLRCTEEEDKNDRRLHSDHCTDTALR